MKAVYASLSLSLPLSPLGVWVLGLEDSDGDWYGMLSTRRLPEDDGDGVLPTDLVVLWSPPEEAPWGASSG